MDERPTAQIIPFPRSRATPPAEPEQPPDVARARLVLALASLEAALASQREAVARWRDSIGELRGSMAGLGDSLHLYRDRLGVLGERVTALNGQAQQLGRWSGDDRRKSSRSPDPRIGMTAPPLHVQEPAARR